MGNYFGMMQRMVEFQKDHELFCFIVNYHALTSQPDAKQLAALSHEAACDFLALGLDPDQCVFWLQSDLPEVTELTWILSNITPMGLLERCHSYKDKIANGVKPSHGLFSYPVLMAADILIMNAKGIPVGQDQKQHVEVTADIAQKFNHRYGEIFEIPEPMISKELGILPGVDGRKMSKSYDNTLEIFAPKEVLKKKVMGIKTDSTPVDEPKPIQDNAIYGIYSAFLDESGKKDLRTRFQAPGLKYGELKNELLDVIWNHFAESRQRRQDYMKDKAGVRKILLKGADKARAVADETMKQVRKAVGIL